MFLYMNFTGIYLFTINILCILYINILEIE